ncbi:hypothetical protein GCM10023225_07240 [Kineococcus glutinatus]|uniref:Uncharacterized protein n=1 Tax=Kineococcus glutinatus TaxID=1070872 RepID=A0ABP9HC55_9ACTN
MPGSRKPAAAMVRRRDCTEPRRGAGAPGEDFARLMDRGALYTTEFDMGSTTVLRCRGDGCPGRPALAAPGGRGARHSLAR